MCRNLINTSSYTVFACLLLLSSGISSLMAQESSWINTLPHQVISVMDSNRVMTYINQSEKTRYKDPLTTQTYVDSAMALSRQLRFAYGIGNAYIAYAAYASAAGAYRESDSLLQLAYPYCVQASLGSSNSLLVIWHMNKGNNAAYTGRYGDAVQASFKAQKLLAEKPGDSVYLSLRTTIYNDIGSMFQYLGQPDKAIPYLNQGLELSKEKSYFKHVASMYVNMGNAFVGKKQFDTATSYFIKAIELSKKDSNAFVLQVAYLSLSNMNITLKRTDEAVAWLEKANKVSPHPDAYMAGVLPDLTLGKIFLNNKNPDRAIYFASRALSRANSMQTPQLSATAHQILAGAYSETGNWQQAYHHLDTFAGTQDSIDKATQLEAINKLEIKSRVAEQDKKLTEQRLLLQSRAAKLQKKNLLILGVSMLSLLLTILLLSFYRNYRHRRRREADKIKIAHLKAVVQGESQERQRIAQELHDGVVSQLLAVKLSLSSSVSEAKASLLPAEEVQQSIHYLNEAMQDLRATAHNLSGAQLLQAGLVESLRKFCDKMQEAGPTEIHFEAFGESGTMSIHFSMMVYRIVQELVQNALKHARATLVIVQLNSTDELLALTVQDNGRGMATADTTVMKSTGLYHIRQQVQQLGGHVDIDTGQKGTSVYLEFTNIDL